MHRKPTPIALIVAVMVALFVVLGGGVTAFYYSTGQPSSAIAADPTPTPTTTPTSPGFAGGMQDPLTPVAATPATGVTASRIVIPAIGVDAPLEQLAIDGSTGALVPPVEWQSAGWYRDGTLPGEVGPAVIAGHIDSYIGPAVFARLDELTPGAEVQVARSDGTVVTFTVDSSQQVTKGAFPTAAVYGPTPQAQLRLVTCDGQFDRASGEYPDNLVVFATLIP